MPGRIRRRLAAILREAGLDVRASDLWAQEGAHRQSAAARWGSNHARRIALGTAHAGEVKIHCWDTMTECVRRGVNLIIRTDEIEVSAKEPLP